MPNIPLLLMKGAIFSLAPNSGIPKGVITPRQNPDDVTRTLKLHCVSGDP
jgi:hypothetical protein